MTVAITQPEIIIRENLNRLDSPRGVYGNQLATTNNITDFYATANPVMFRNRLHNGSMDINQRATTIATISGTSLLSTYGNGVVLNIDRWAFLFFNSSGSFNPSITWAQVADHPFKGSNGNCLQVTCTTASTPSSSTTTDAFAITQKLEAQYIADLFNGSASQSVTISFWVKTNVSGTYSLELRDVGTPGGSYIYTTAFNIVQTGVWEQVIITIPPNYISSMPNTNAVGMWMEIMLASNQNILTVTSGPNLNVWTQYNTHCWASANQVNLFATANNYFKITNVQFEAGTQATPYEIRPYGIELIQCQRYCIVYEQGGAGYDAWSMIGNGFAFSSYQTETIIYLPVAMRTPPGVTVTSSILSSGPFSIEYNGSSQVYAYKLAESYGWTTKHGRLRFDAVSGSGSLTAGGPTYVSWDGRTSGGYMIFSSDL